MKNYIFYCIFKNHGRDNKKISIQARKDGIKRLVVGGAIVDKDSNILVLRRGKGEFVRGIHEIPSGKVEKGAKIYKKYMLNF